MLNLFLLAASLGFSMAQLVRFIFFMSQYGHPLFRLRFGLAYIYKKNRVILKRHLAIARNLNIPDSVELMENAFALLASKDSRMMPFVCQVCFGMRLVLLGVVAFFVAGMQLEFILIFTATGFYFLYE